MMETYPNRAGFTDPTTSKDAADAVEGSGKAQTLRDEVMRVLRVNERTLRNQYFTAYSLPNYGLTADEIAAELGESPFSIRPRVTELAQRGLIERTGERRKSSNGRMSHVWRLK
jgi:hypothetical protein